MVFLFWVLYENHSIGGHKIWWFSFLTCLLVNFTAVGIHFRALQVTLRF